MAQPRQYNKAHKAAYDAARYADPVQGAKIRARSCAYYHVDPKRSAIRWRRNKYPRLYGITGELYDSMYAAQGGLCAICESPRDVLVVDHEHIQNGENDTVRALLCNPCNVGLGMLHHSPERLMRAAEYLDNHSGQET